MRKIVVGEGSCGIAAGAAKVYSALEPLAAGSGVELKITGCIGMCYLEPIVDVYEDDTLLQRLVQIQKIFLHKGRSRNLCRGDKKIFSRI